MKHGAVWLSLGLLVCTTQVWAGPAERTDRRGDRIEHRLDERGDRIESRLDRRGAAIDHRLISAAARSIGAWTDAQDAGVKAGFAVGSASPHRATL